MKFLFGVNNAKELAEESFLSKGSQSLIDLTYLKKEGAHKKFLEMIRRSNNRRVVRREINSGKDIVINDGDVNDFENKSAYLFRSSTRNRTTNRDINRSFSLDPNNKVW